MGTLGETLRQARLDKGVSLAQAERETRIRRKYLEALEAEDFGALPAPVYVRGFIRTYADYLGLNPEAMVDLYQPARGREERLPIRPATPQIERRRVISLRPVLIALAVVAGALLLGYLWTQYNSFAESLRQAEREQVLPSSRSQPTAGVAKPLPTRTPTPAPATPTPTPTATPVRGVVVEVRLTGRSWIEVTADGRPVFQDTLPTGTTKTFQAEQTIKMRVSNAGAVQVVVNGVAQPPLGATGQAVEAEWGR